ncbi:MAG: xylulokinase [Rhodobacteraceae bacterium]|nr:xylulokinase [Paracoccaceae bacterium]
MYLGIDIGTSAVKVLLTEDGQATLGSASVPLTTRSPQPGWSEQDAGSWWTAVVDGCRQLRGSVGDVFGAVRGIGLSGQMHAALCLDARLAPLCPAILWNDNRAVDESAAMERASPGLARICGVPPLPGFTAPKLLWLREHEPDILARTAHILGAKDFVALKLHGRRVTDMCDASGMLLLDVAARAWSPDLIDAAGISMAMLPALHEGTDVGGALTSMAAAELGLPAGLPVAVGGGDVAVGAVGAGVIHDGTALLSLGTSGQIFVATSGFRPAPAQMLHAFAHCIPGMWSQMAALLNGARPLAWFAEIAGVPVGTLLVEAESASHPPLFLPYLTGERTPHGDPRIRGGFYGLDNATTRGDMMRGVVEAVAYSFADAAAALRAADTSFADPLVVGGGARSDLMLQTLADVLGTQVHRGAGAETGPALGAARLAMVAAGAAGLDEVARPPAIARSFEPNGKAADYHAGRLDLFRAFYRTAKPLADQAASTRSGSFAPVMNATASDIV